MEPKDLFKLVLDTRNFEITNFWQRCNYFLVLNTGLAIAFFNLKDKMEAFGPFVAALGVVVSWLWHRVALGSKFWQVHWEKKLTQVEDAFVAAGVLDRSLRLFNQPTHLVQEEVRVALKAERHRGVLAQLVDLQIGGKPSVTLAMISLSLLFVAAWFGVLVATLPFAK
jgi:hypothetical protein